MKDFVKIVAFVQCFECAVAFFMCTVSFIWCTVSFIWCTVSFIWCTICMERGGGSFYFVEQISIFLQLTKVKCDMVYFQYKGKLYTNFYSTQFTNAFYDEPYENSPVPSAILPYIIMNLCFS